MRDYDPRQKASVTKYGGLESEHVTQDRVERESSEPDPSLLRGGWQENILASWQVAAKLSPGSKLVLLEQPWLYPTLARRAQQSIPFPSQHKCFPWSPWESGPLRQVRKHGADLWLPFRLAHWAFVSAGCLTCPRERGGEVSGLGCLPQREPLWPSTSGSDPSPGSLLK